ncbi:MAG: 7-carboxy-7-deazaguanine synthase QueE [Bdellovibrionales bacterium]
MGRIQTVTNTLRISEIFGPTIQGEGALIGQPTVFVRTGGCDYRCTWCDTLYAVESKYRHDWKPMTAQSIMDEVKHLSNNNPLTISLSGGNPATQDCSELITLGHQDGYTFALETQGSIKQDWFKDLDTLTLSPKPPSSKMDTNWDILDDCVNATGDNTKTALKIVVFDDIDYAYAQDVAKRYPALPLYLQPGNHETEGAPDIDGLNKRLQWLADKVTNDNWFDAHVLPQLHVLIWGNERGV